MKLSKSGKSFIKRWASYPLRSLMYRHSKKIILVLLAVIAGLLLLLLQPKAAGVTVPEPNTDALNDVAEAISSNAQVIQDFVDTIDVSEIRGVMDDMSEYVNAPLKGAPTIVIIVLIFIMVMMVVRKVIGR